ncbi:MAG: DUF523 and DUF1722 domain-containing protein [Myxococcota bacterium]|nr:DUF523 and DUF1722 domain-containing protein [Myxococcota bacterium]
MSSSADPWRDDAPLRIGISSCLLGSEVRWDGGHKHDRFLSQQLAPFVEWVPVCPEVELGLGTPREPIRLERHGEEIRLRGTKSGEDHTRAMQRFAARRARELGKLELSGYVFKKDSPSCGVERVRIWNAAGMPQKNGQGVFAGAVQQALPDLPIEEEGRLKDPLLRENWIERIFAHRRLTSFLSRRFGVGDLVRFHTAHKLQLLAHSEPLYRELGRLVASARDMPRAELRERYAHLFMRAMAGKATRRRQVNVLQHALGHFRKRLDDASREEVHTVVEDYRQGHVPLIVPITLIRHHVRVLDVEYLAGQVYLEPHPKELMLRNHV